MSRTTLVVLATILYVFFPISKIDGLPAGSNSILNEIKNDNEICATHSTFSESRYVKSCQQANFPVDKNETLGKLNENKFLCLGLYQKIWEICFWATHSKTSGKTLPENSTLFDTRVQQSFLNNSVDMTKFCNNWHFSHSPEYKKIENYVVQLENILQNEATCIKLCSTYGGQVEPLCAVLASMDEISLKLKLEKTQGNVMGKEKTVTGAETNNSQVANPDEAKAKAMEAGTQNATVKGAPIAQKIAQAVQPTILKTKNHNEQANATLEKNSTEPRSQKPEVVQPADTKTPKENLSERKSMATENGNKVAQNLTKPANADEKIDSKPSPLPNKAEVKPDHTSEGQAPARDNVQDDIEKNPSGIEQGDEDTDVISQHTEDDDITLDRRPSDDVNEIESPIIPTLEDDMNENPVRAPEKSGFVPQFPGIRDDDDSHFFGYFTVIGVICLAGYVGYHNKQKILAMVLEGRRSRGGRGRRRPSTANYRKLDCTLEEAVTSQCNSNVTHVIY